MHERALLVTPLSGGRRMPSAALSQYAAPRHTQCTTRTTRRDPTSHPVQPLDAGSRATARRILLLPSSHHSAEEQESHESA